MINRIYYFNQVIGGQTDWYLSLVTVVPLPPLPRYRIQKLVRQNEVYMGFSDLSPGSTNDSTNQSMYRYLQCNFLLGLIHTDPNVNMKSNIFFDKERSVSTHPLTSRLVNFRFGVVKNLVHYPRWAMVFSENYLPISVKWNLPNKDTNICCQSLRCILL